MGILSRVFGGGGGEDGGNCRPADVYLDMRNQALGLARQGDGSAPLALLMETGMEDACYTLLAHVDGSASLYFSNGGGIIGAGTHPRCAETARELVALSERFTADLVPASEYPLPRPGRTRFYRIDPGRVLSAEFDEQGLGEERLPLSPLFHKGHELIAVIRHVSEFRESEEPLLVAVFDEDVERVNALLGEGANPGACTAQGTPALALAVSTGSEPMVELLLGAGAEANAMAPGPGDSREAPILNFAASRSAALCGLLLAAGARTDAADSTGLSPLMTAAHIGNAESLVRLLDGGAPLEQQDESGYTALMFAANAGQADCARELVARGAEVEATDRDGSTPIMFAAQQGSDAIVRLLLERGADPTRQGSHGFAAIDFARQNGHASTLALLEARGSYGFGKP